MQLLRLDDDGAPSVVQRTLIAPPRSRLGPLSPGERAMVAGASPLAGKYDTRVDRESAHEVLLAKASDADRVALEASLAQGPARRDVPAGARLQVEIRGMVCAACARC